MNANYYILNAKSARAQMRAHALEARAKRVDIFNDPEAREKYFEDYIGYAISFRTIANNYFQMAKDNEV